MPLWFITIMLWLIVGSTISFLTRRSMAKYYIQALQIRDEESDTDPYQRGFKDGAMGIKMYYTILEKMPNSEWIVTNCMKKLDTRAKLLETLTEVEKNAIHESSSA